MLFQAFSNQDLEAGHTGAVPSLWCLKKINDQRPNNSHLGVGYEFRPDLSQQRRSRNECSKGRGNGSRPRPRRRASAVTLLSPSWWIYVVWFSRNHGVDRHPALPGSSRIGSLKMWSFGRLVGTDFPRGRSRPMKTSRSKICSQQSQVLSVGLPRYHAEVVIWVLEKALLEQGGYIILIDQSREWLFDLTYFSLFSELLLLLLLLMTGLSNQLWKIDQKKHLPILPFGKASQLYMHKYMSEYKMYKLSKHKRFYRGIRYDLTRHECIFATLPDSLFPSSRYSLFSTMVNHH